MTVDKVAMLHRSFVKCFIFLFLVVCDVLSQEVAVAATNTKYVLITRVVTIPFAMILFLHLLNMGIDS